MKTKLRILKWTFYSLCYGGLITPLLVMIIKNWNEYFYHKEGFTVGLGGIIAVILVLLAIKVGFKKFNRIFWASGLLITVYCLNTIIQDTLPLTFAFWLGILIYSIFEKPMRYYSKRLEAYTEEEVRVVARKDVAKKYEEMELENDGRC